MVQLLRQVEPAAPVELFPHAGQAVKSPLVSEEVVVDPEEEYKQLVSVAQQVV
jgi:hypothetical protein